MVFEVGGRLLKKYDDKGYRRAFNQAFTGFPKDVGFSKGLSAPQPDFVEGLELQGYDPFPVHKHVCGAVLHKDNPRSVTLPHVAGEWKGPGKDMKEARLQSAYDGAALVYARSQPFPTGGNLTPPAMPRSQLPPRTVPISASMHTIPPRRRTVRLNTTSIVSSRQAS